MLEKTRNQNGMQRGYVLYISFMSFTLFEYSEDEIDCFIEQMYVKPIVMIGNHWYVMSVQIKIIHLDRRFIIFWPKKQ